MTVSDWIDIAKLALPYVAAGVGLLWGWVQRRYRLPKKALAVLKMLKQAGVSVEAIECMLTTASAMASATNAERRAWAVEKLQDVGRQTGIEITDATANLLVEWTYNRLKAKP